MQMVVHNTLSRFYTTKKRRHESTHSIRICFEVCFKHKRSQECLRSHDLPKIFRISSHFVLWEVVSQTEYCCSPKIKHLAPPKKFGLATPLVSSGAVDETASLLQRRTSCHRHSFLLNWRIYFVIIVNSTQLNLQRAWIINNCVCGSLMSQCWLNRVQFWNLLSESFFTL